jgi:predicted component of type VI protein secretion system
MKMKKTIVVCLVSLFVLSCQQASSDKNADKAKTEQLQDLDVTTLSKKITPVLKADDRTVAERAKKITTLFNNTKMDRETKLKVLKKSMHRLAMTDEDQKEIFILVDKHLK